MVKVKLVRPKLIILADVADVIANTSEKHNFKKYADNWFEVFSKPNIAEATATTYQRQLTLHLNPFFGDTKDVKAAQAAAGHTTSAMTLERYVKGRGTSSQTAAAIDQLYRS